MTSAANHLGRSARKHPAATVATIFLALLLVISFAGLISISAPNVLQRAPSSVNWSFATDPDLPDLSSRLQPPTAPHPLGTDELGRDVLARMIAGARVSLAVGLLAATVALLIGTLIGALAGYYGGATDWVLSRLIEVILCFPVIFLVLAIAGIAEKPSIPLIILVLGLTSWPNEARLVRGEVMRLKEIGFATASRAAGARDRRVIFVHLIPHALPPLIVYAIFSVASAILTESALSFLGLGVPLPAASWGSILASADEYLFHAWWLALFPGLAIFLTVLSLHAIGEAIRKEIDPRG